MRTAALIVLILLSPALALLPVVTLWLVRRTTD